MNQPSNSVNMTPSGIEKVNRLRVYFGHQSVGDNILNGLRNLASEDKNYKLKIVETDQPEKIIGPFFAHFRVGSNMTPESKIKSFRQHISQSGQGVDVALFKFCYLDVEADTDTDNLFQKYQSMSTDLKQQFPHVVFIHVTVPLKTIDSGVKRFIKTVLGKSTGEEANIRRTVYNEMLRNTYLGREMLFDLAAIESTAADGSRDQGVKDGFAFEALHPAYTDDGEHLNPLGSRVAALGLLQVLADVAEPSGKK